MEHSVAINNHAAERYLLGELSEPERDSYEEHFFCCRHCAEEIKSASEFMENARQVIQNEMRAESYSRAARRSTWKDWFNFKSMWQPLPVAACLLFVTLIGYQNSVVIPRLSEMASIQLVTTSTVMLHVARGTPKEVPVPRAESFAVGFEIPPAKDVVTSYQVSVLDVSSGKTLLSRTVTPEKKSFELQCPAGLLRPGRYDVQLQAMNGSSKGELSTFSFELKFKD